MQNGRALVSRILKAVEGERHTHEQIVGVWNVAADAKEFHEIMELPVNIAAYLQALSACCSTRTWDMVGRPYCDWCRHLHDVALLDEQLPRLVTELSHLRLRDGTAGSQLRNGPTAQRRVSLRPYPAETRDSVGCACLLVEVAHGLRRGSAVLLKS